MYFSSLLAAAVLLSAETPDTLQTAIVVADKGIIVSKTDTIPIPTGSTAAEVLEQSPGLYIGDNGGLAGLKTVSLRGLGSAHTSIYIDGVRVGNVQSGQADIGKLGIGQFNRATIDYAQNSISFTSERPSFAYGRKVGGRASLSAGSFGTWMPYGQVNFRLSDNVCLSANAAGVLSKGNFRYGDGAVRENNDIRQLLGGLDAFGLTSCGSWHAKAHYGSSEAGMPGSLAYPSTDRQQDRNAYIQGHIEQRFCPLYSLTASAKYSFDRMDYKSSWGDSKYNQHEIQVNSAHSFAVTKWLRLSLAADFTWDKLNSTQYAAERYCPTTAIAAAFRTPRFNARLAVEYNGSIDKGGLSRHTFSPSADLRFTPFESLAITAFGKRACRIPTFNELYYTGYGNPELRPEDAWLSGLGLDFRKTAGVWTFNTSADGFLNILTDKIISAPSQADPYLWLPYNIGKVRSTGLDASAGISFRKADWKAGLEAKYSFQYANDRTPDSSTFGQQIPYVARHTALLNACLSYKGWKLESSWNLRAGRRDAYGEMPDWNTLDATASKEIRFKGCGPMLLFVKGRNLCDHRYESVSGYPMPGRSVTGGFSFRF